MTRRQSQERTRHALLDAAAEAFFDDRWAKASLNALSATAGVTKQTLLRNFGSKDGLLMQAVMRGAKQVRDQRWSTPTDDVAGAVENLLEHYEAWGERSIRIGAWQTNRPAALAVLSRAARQIHYEWVDHAFARWLEPLDGEAHTNLRAGLIALCDVQTWWILSHHLGLPRAQVHTILLEQIERLLRAPAQAATGSS